MNRRFIITEDDKRHILSMYNLITEAPETATNTQFKNNFRFEFKAGYWSVENPANVSDGKSVKQQIDNFAKEFATWYQNLQSQKFPIGEIKIVLNASESRIPNTDQENGGVKIGEGELSKKRLDSLQNYMSALFANYKNVVFEANNLGAQGEAYTGKNKEELKKYQYVTVSVDAVATIACNSELSIQGQQQAAPDFKFNFPFAADPNAKGYKFQCNAFQIPDRFGGYKNFTSNTDKDTLRTLFSLVLGKVYAKYPGSAAFNGVTINENADNFLTKFNDDWFNGVYKDAVKELTGLIGANNVAAVFGPDEAKLATSFVNSETSLNVGRGVNIFDFTYWATDFLWKTGLKNGIEDYNKIPNIKVAAKRFIINNVDYAEILFNLLLKSTKDWTKLSEDGAKKEIENAIKGSSEITKAFKEEGNKTKVSGLKNAFKYFVTVEKGPVTVELAENKLEVFAPLSNTVFKIKRICT